jgi:hypothetical protein
MPSVTPTCCSLVLRPSCLPWSCAFSSATVRPSRRDRCNSILRVSGFPVSARCPSLPGGSATRRIQPMLLKLSALEADGSAIVSCGRRSCSRPSVPSAPRNWPSAKLVNKAPSFTTMASIVCRSSSSVLRLCGWVAPPQTLPCGEQGPRLGRRSEPRSLVLSHKPARL